MSISSSKHSLIRVLQKGNVIPMLILLFFAVSVIFYKTASLLVSLSFWLSVAGVFYIFLLLQYTQAYSAKVISFIFIPLGIFVLMLPVVHGIFGVTSIYQLLSPLLSILFVPFYPLAMLLHLLGIGGIFDHALLWLFTLPTQSVEHLLPLWAVASYVGVSIVAIWYRKVFYSVLGFAILYGFYLFT